MRSPQTLLFASLFCLLNLVTDENSESESDTEEKLKGEIRRWILPTYRSFTGGVWKYDYKTASTTNVTHVTDVVVWNVFLRLSAHSQRLVSVQSMLRQTGRYRTLERDLMELQERKLFEYFIVVALHKAKAGVPYLPEVTQQFPLKVKNKTKEVLLRLLAFFTAS